jgi:hypothetical protein
MSEEESIKSEESTKDLTVWSSSKKESIGVSTSSVSSVAGSRSTQDLASTLYGNNSSSNTYREGIDCESNPCDYSTTLISKNDNNERVAQLQEKNDNASESDSFDADKRVNRIRLEFDSQEPQQQEEEEVTHRVFIQDDDGVETIFEIQNETGPTEENKERQCRVCQDPKNEQGLSSMKNTTTVHEGETSTAIVATLVGKVNESDSDQKDRVNREDKPFTLRTVQQPVDGSDDLLSTASVESSVSNASTRSRAAKELILSVTKEEEEDRSDKASITTFERKGHDEKDKSQIIEMNKITIDSLSHENDNNEVHSAEREGNDDDAVQSNDIRAGYAFDAAASMKQQTKSFMKSPLRISTLVASDTSKSNDIIKSPIRCESPGMRRRREELDRSHRSIRELEEQLNLAQLEQQQQQHAEEHARNVQSQHNTTNCFFEAYEIQDCGESLSSATSSTTSFGLLHTSSRTLLTSSDTMAISNDRCDRMSCASNSRDQMPRMDDATAMRKAFSRQHDSSSLMPSDEQTANKQHDSSGGTPKAANRSSPAMERDHENGGDREIDAIKVYYEEKLMRQRRTHEHQIDEIIEQLNNIETSYGIEIASLKKRLSQKEIMTEALTHSLSEMKQQHEIAIAKLEEARNEVQAGNDRYTALKHRMEREKSEAVETACNEIRAAAESQFASAQKTFIKLKQDYVATCDDRNSLKRQCNELAGKVETLEAKTRSYQNKISKLLAEGAEAKAKMATEKADALKMKQAYTEKVQAFVQKEKDMEFRIAKADRECEEAYALLQKAIKEKEVLKKENADLQSVCEELMTIVEETHRVTK